MPYICLGIGCGVLGGSVCGLIKHWKLRKDPQLAKQVTIESKDERNLLIAYKAKAQAFNVMLYLYSALIMFLALVQVKAYITLIFVGAYVFIIGIFVYFLTKYHKEM